MRAVASRMDGNPSKIILEYFCSYSCPSEERSLLAKIDQDSLEYGIELEKAVRYLTSITGNGKNFVCKPKGATNLYERAERDKPKFEKKQRMSRHESGDAYSAGGAKKYPKRACFFCEDEGHIASTCPLKKEFLEKKKRSTGSANVVETTREIHKTEENDCQYASC